MRNPFGFRAESSRTPKASRAGALYSTPRYSTPAAEPGVSPHPSSPSLRPAQPVNDTAVPHRFPTMDGRASSAGDPFDTCTCGDLRHQHDYRGDCRICRSGTATWDNCLGFRTASEVS